MTEQKEKKKKDKMKGKALLKFGFEGEIDGGVA
jgi:hypothetical protein